ncbi:MAG: phosphate-starvation-inducible PsiE family protein [Spongiibacteraceae bacterium]|nr:phosphate-starvation-inducible PsiE family protein [Spongiibacteraceae bacterium]
MLDKFFDVFYPKFEKFIVLALALSIMIAISYATLMFLAVLVKGIINIEPFWSAMTASSSEFTIAHPITRLQDGLYHVFGGFLLILLGIELISTVRTFSKENHIKMESIVGIAIIATARHLITLDYHHTDPLIIFAAGFVVISLIVGYFLLRLKPYQRR